MKRRLFGFDEGDAGHQLIVLIGRRFFVFKHPLSGIRNRRWRKAHPNWRP